MIENRRAPPRWLSSLTCPVETYVRRPPARLAGQAGGLPVVAAVAAAAEPLDGSGRELWRVAGLLRVMPGDAGPTPWLTVCRRSETPGP